MDKHRLKQFRTVLYNNDYYVKEEVLKLPTATWNRLKPPTQVKNYSWFSKDINLTLFRYLLSLSRLLTSARHTSLYIYASVEKDGRISINGKPTTGEIAKFLRKLEKACGNERYLKLFGERLFPDSVSDEPGSEDGLYLVYRRYCYRLSKAYSLAGITDGIIPERKSHAFDRVVCGGK